jgi:ABC-type sugar transport system ATPase subunit
MDEPTSALNQQETKNLFKIIRSLQKQGVTIIYISHKLDEIFEIADNITIMRDGCVVGTHSIKDCTREMIVKLMTGKTMDEDYFSRNIDAQQTLPEREPVLTVKDLSSNSRRLKVVSFTLLFRAIFGADVQTQGESSSTESLLRSGIRPMRCARASCSYPRTAKWRA